MPAPAPVAAPLPPTAPPHPPPRTAADCPYLATVCRPALDFDFEKCCSVTLGRVNVYACLVCGRYLGGRAPGSPAHTHALEAGHHVFMRLADGKAFVLPDGYEVEDPSLGTIRAVLHPKFTPADIARLDADPAWARALDGTPFAPGVVGLNNLGATDYANAAVQALCRVGPLRDWCLAQGGDGTPASSSAPPPTPPLAAAFAELVRKVWNPRAFKGHASPHEFLVACGAASGGRFGPAPPAPGPGAGGAATASRRGRGDPVDFLAWLLNALHTELAAPPRPPGAAPLPPGAAARAAAGRPSIISRCFQGALTVTTEPGSGGVPPGAPPRVVTTPFLMLGLALPPAPLYPDALEARAIPQVPLPDLLRRYDGSRVTDDPVRGRQTFRIARVPPFLILHVRRFARAGAGLLGGDAPLEKNPTVVTFPVRGLRLGEIIPLPAPTTFDLVANIVHDGPASAVGAAGVGGAFKAHVRRKADGAWYEVSDLAVSDVLPQVVALSEAYVQVYERAVGPPQGGGGGGGGGGKAAAMEEG